MYEFIKGKLKGFSPGFFILETHGIGYKIHTPFHMFTNTLLIDEEWLLYTTLLIKDQDIQLYGFSSSQERDVFQLLISSQGIGPKLGLTILGHISIADLAEAVLQKKDSPLCHIPGIGKKMANKIILELSDKWKKKFQQNNSCHAPPSLSVYQSEAIMALTNLGYTEQQATFATQKVLTKGSPPELPQLIVQSLQLLRA